MFIFSVWDQKKLFWVNLVKKIKFVSLSLNLLLRLIWISGIQWWCLLFLFLTINIVLGQIWSENSKLFIQSEIWYKDWFEYAKFSDGIYFICFRLEIATHFRKFGRKNSNCQFKLKTGTYTNSNMKNSIVMLFFLCFRPEVYFFKKHLFEKSKLFVKAEI